MDDQIKMRRLVLGGMAALAIIVTVLVLGLSSFSHSHKMKQALDAQQKSFATSPYADPALSYLPYGDIGYNIDPVIKTINAKQTLVLQITVKFDESDRKLSVDQQAALIKQREQAALSYLRSQGSDPSKYRIEYVTPL